MITVSKYLPRVPRPVLHASLILMSPTDSTAGLEGAVSFYGSQFFLQSPAALELDARFGAPVNVNPFIAQIGRFLRVLNASFNLQMAEQRLESSRQLNIAFWAFRDDIQKGLINLAAEEIDDGIRVMQNVAGPPLHPNEQANLTQARNLIFAGLVTTDPAVRRDNTIAAKALVVSARATFGTNLNFQMGTGNLMF